MKYIRVSKSEAEDFGRLIGVKQETFENLVKILKDVDIHKQAEEVARTSYASRINYC
jgi:response regulator of citrate/malate metabolism